MKKQISIILISIPFIIFSLSGKSQSVYENAATHPCLKCHSKQSFTFFNEVLSKEQRRLMNPYYLIDSTAVKIASHKNLDCIDCHSTDYSNYPHTATLKLEATSSCIDCHGGDPTYESYKFDQINEDFQKSSHFLKYGEDFTCTKCHNIHTYKPIARNDSTISGIAEHSNLMCLTCHNETKGNVMSNNARLQLDKVHEWLPNQVLHFKHVRCIECHAMINDSIMVAHNILPKSEAVKNCTECHNANSRLKSTLYKFANLQKRSEDNSIKSIISNESYVIGSQQYPLLTKLSYIILLVTVVAIIIHAIVRFLTKK